MSVVTPDEVLCGKCKAVNSAEHRFCGGCGAKLVAALRPGETAAARRRFRDAPWVLVVSGGIFAVSALVALAAFLVLQIFGWTGFITGDTPAFVIAIFVAAFAAACISLLVFAVASLKIARRNDVVAGAVDTTRRHAGTARDRGRQGYEQARPKVDAAAKRGRQKFEDDVAPAMSAGAEKAAAEARKAAAKARERFNQRRGDR